MEERENESNKTTEMMEAMFQRMEEQNKSNLEMMEKIASRPVIIERDSSCVIS